jgi:hypothetical protein
MLQNALTGVRSRHVNSCYHFICENVKDRIVKVEFVRYVDNDSDIKHVKKFLGSIDEFGSH